MTRVANFPRLPFAGSLHFVPVARPNVRGTFRDDREYRVEVRRGATVATLGRVLRTGDDWMALGVGQSAWTRYAGTRRDAVTLMLRGRTWNDGVSA